MKWSKRKGQRGFQHTYTPPRWRRSRGEDTHGDHDCQLLFPWRLRMSSFTDLWQRGGTGGTHLGGQTLAGCEMEPNKVAPKVIVRPVTPLPTTTTTPASPPTNPTPSGCAEGRRDGIYCPFPGPFRAFEYAGRSWPWSQVVRVRMEAAADRSESQTQNAFTPGFQFEEAVEKQEEVRALGWLTWTVTETRSKKCLKKFSECGLAEFQDGCY